MCVCVCVYLREYIMLADLLLPLLRFYRFSTLHGHPFGESPSARKWRSSGFVQLIENVLYSISTSVCPLFFLAFFCTRLHWSRRLRCYAIHDVFTRLFGPCLPFFFLFRFLFRGNEGRRKRRELGFLISLIFGWARMFFFGDLFYPSSFLEYLHTYLKSKRIFFHFREYRSLKKRLFIC